MSTIANQQQLQPTAHSAHGSFGPVIGVVAVVLILSAAAVVIGRLCSGRSIMGIGHYDMESWVESKFSSCVDGRIFVPRPRTTSDGAGENGLAPAPVVVAGHSVVAEQQAEHENVGS